MLAKVLIVLVALTINTVVGGTSHGQSSVEVAKLIFSVPETRTVFLYVHGGTQSVTIHLQEYVGHRDGIEEDCEVRLEHVRVTDRGAHSTIRPPKVTIDFKKILADTVTFHHAQGPMEAKGQPGVVVAWQPNGSPMFTGSAFSVSGFNRIEAESFKLFVARYCPGIQPAR